MSEKQKDTYENKENLVTVAELLRQAEDLIDDNYAIQTARNDAGELSVLKFSDAELEAEYRYHGEFTLPERPGSQTLDIHLLAADPYAGSVLEDSDYADYGPDAIAKIVHSHTGEDGEDTELKDTYIVRRVPGDDLILEKSVSDETESNRDFAHAQKLAKRRLGAEAVGDAIAGYARRRKDREDAAHAVVLDERQLGLHVASDEDRENLQKLLDEAEIRS